MDKLWSALILTGGTSKRFGSDKSEAIFNGKALIDFLISSLPADVAVVIVGPDRDEFPSTIQMIKEDPPGGGPVAGIAAGLPLIETEYVAVLATDMPYSTGLVPLLLSGLSNEVEAVLADRLRGDEKLLRVDVERVRVERPGQHPARPRHLVVAGRQAASALDQSVDRASLRVTLKPASRHLPGRVVEPA